jgi:hypothetical protein
MHQSCMNSNEDCDSLPKRLSTVEDSSSSSSGSKCSTRNRVLRWSYITATGVLFLSCILRPAYVKKFRRAIPRGQRSISINWSRFSTSFQTTFHKRVHSTIRHLEDGYYQNNRDDQSGENDQAVDDQMNYKAAVDDAYYNKTDDAYYYYYPPVGKYYHLFTASSLRIILTTVQSSRTKTTFICISTIQ